MPKFRYIVINPENKQLSGTINAPDEKDAREELNQLGFSIISINQIDETQDQTADQQNLVSFEFSATDKNLKHVAGTIQAEDSYSAYKRLVKEYIFEVEYLVDSNLPENKKIPERQKGVFELQNRMDQEEFTQQKSKMQEQMDLKEFEQKQQTLQLQVEFVLKKVKEMLDLYEPEMKPETKEKIRKLVDKILRIKSSTNLDYIRKSCEELLTFLQKEEIFLHQDARQRERTQMALEAKSMMMDLHRSKSSANQDLREQLINWREEHITNNQHVSFGESIINVFIDFIIGFGEETVEIKNLRHSLAAVNQQFWQYLVLYYQSSEPEFKNEARRSLKKLWKERKNQKKGLKMLQKKLKEERKNRQDSTPWENFSQEILHFSGWLLAFYLIYYFVTNMLLTKDLNLIEIPQNLAVGHSVFLKYFLATLFLFHSSLSIKLHFFKRNEAATLIITPLFLVATTLILLNF